MLPSVPSSMGDACLLSRRVNIQFENGPAPSKDQQLAFQSLSKSDEQVVRVHEMLGLRCSVFRG